MNPQIVLISGAVAAGKSSVASLLISKHGFAIISSGEFLRNLAAKRSLTNDRASLQSLGDQLDLVTDFAWLIDEVAVPAIAGGGGAQGRWLVDAVRKQKQVQHFKTRFDIVTHVHISAPEHILRQRYVQRLVENGATLEAAEADYNQAVLHANEMEARSLSELADLEFDTSLMSPGEIAATIGGGIEEGSST